MDEELFKSFVRGRFPLSENSGAAKHWLSHDPSKPGAFVPRADCSLTTIRILSVLFGIFGVDHFYMRSPVTGMAKLLTGGGAGLWWLWDIIQLFAEKDRVLNYGMSAPLDLVTGIGQGMITDKSFSYNTKAPYSAWIIGIIFGFIGIDSLLAKNGGQFLRKVLEFLMFVGSVILIVNYWNGGLTFGSIFAIIVWSMIASFLASIILAEYISVMSLVFGGDMFSKGIEFTAEEDAQYNGFFAWMIKNAGFSTERQAEIVRDLQYGGIPANKLREMFEIRHTSDSKATDAASRVKAEGSNSSWVSFFLLLCSPFLIVWNFITYIFDLIATAIIPWYGPMKIAREAAMAALKRGSETIGQIGQPDAQGKGGLTNQLKGMVSRAAVNEIQVQNSVQSAIQSQLQAATSSVSDQLKAAPKHAATRHLLTQKGGGQPLSTEAQVFGAVTVALIGGGVIKGLVDYLITE